MRARGIRSGFYNCPGRGKVRHRPRLTRAGIQEPALRSSRAGRHRAFGDPAVLGARHRTGDADRPGDLSTDHDWYSSCYQGQPRTSCKLGDGGAVGLLSLCYCSDRAEASHHLNRLVRLARGRFGVVVHGRLGPIEQEAQTIITGADTVLLTCEAREELAEAVARWRGVARRLGLIVTCEAEARLGAELGVDLLVAKGNEAGGQVGEETTFVLLQRLLSRLELPVYAWGGIGRCTAAACRVAGAAGVVLDWQLALTRESAVVAGFRRRLALMDGSETIALRGRQQPIAAHSIEQHRMA